MILIFLSNNFKKLFWFTYLCFIQLELMFFLVWSKEMNLIFPYD